MIQINDKFSFERDKYGWQLHEKRKNRSTKENAPEFTTYTTNHGRIDHLVTAVIDRSAGGAESLQGVADAIKQASRDLLPALKEIKP